jgi:hypothetical protein
MEALSADPESAFDVAIGLYAEETAETLADEPLCENLDLDKSWAILRFLLLKAGEQAGRSEYDWSTELLCGEIIGEPADYAGPHLRDIDETREFAAFLDPLPVDRLFSLFDAEEMAEEDVYMVWEDVVGDEQSERELREYASAHYVSLREYVLKAAASRCGLLLVVN